jgi:Xaa-Pro aminopeptidase
MNKLKTFLFILLLNIAASYAQEAKEKNFYQYDKDLLSKEFHKSRREALREKMEDNTVAVFFANPVRNRSNDVDFQYHQDPDFYYLTGLKEPNSMLLVFKSNVTIGPESANEIIFVQDRNPQKEIWDGRRLGKEGASQFLGFEKVMLNRDFENSALDFSHFNKVYFKPLPTDVADDKRDPGDLYDLLRAFKLKTLPVIELSSTGKGDSKKNFKKKIQDRQNLDNKSLTRFMAGLRQVKTQEEIVLLKKAIDATCMAHIELMKALEPGMTEFQAQGIIEYFFKHYGAEYPGFPSILGGGENACILHYTSNRRTLTEKDLLVADVGAEYHGYTADVTRTLPVSGKFSPEQKIIYDIVLEAQTEGIKACVAGNSFWQPHSIATQIIQQRLLEQGIIKKPQEVRLYFMHGTSHYLGLDVHDAGLYGNLEPGNVITVEPGIYIPEGSPCDPKWWNIGVRIEDDILITEGEPLNLSGRAPRTTEEIEKLMQEKSIFNTIGK